jgi:hypothetical protein
VAIERPAGAAARAPPPASLVERKTPKGQIARQALR